MIGMVFTPARITHELQGLPPLPLSPNTEVPPPEPPRTVAALDLTGVGAMSNRRSSCASSPARSLRKSKRANRSVADLVTTARDEMKKALGAAEQAGDQAVVTGSRRASWARRKSNDTRRRARKSQQLSRREMMSATARTHKIGGGDALARSRKPGTFRTRPTLLGETMTSYGSGAGSGERVPTRSPLPNAEVTARRAEHRRRHRHRERTTAEVERIKLHMAKNRLAVSKTTRKLDKLASFLEDLAARADSGGLTKRVIA